MAKQKTEKPKKERQSREITTIEALIILIVFVAIMIWNALKGGMGTAVGLLYCAVLGFAYGILVLKHSWQDMLDAALKVIGNVMPVLLFLLCTGMVQAAWIASGTVPYIIYVGLGLISPQVYLLVAFLVTFVTSMCCSNTWSTITTVGLALGGVGMALGVPLPMIAGAIVGGSFMADRWSPINDTFCLISATTENNVMKMFKSMIPTSVVMLVVSCALYLILGFRFAGGAMQMDEINALREGLAAQFNFSVGPVLLIPLILVIVGAVMKFDPLPVLFVPGVLGGTLFAMIFQKIPFTEASSIFWNGYVSSTGNATIDELLTRGGVGGVSDLIMLLFAAFMFAGCINKLGILDKLLSHLLDKIKHTGSLVLSCTVTTIAAVFLSASVYVSAILNANIYRNAFRKKGLDPVVLGRTIAESVGYSGTYCPWSGGSVLVASTLGVAPFVWIPYCFAGWIPMIANIIFSYLGIFTPKAKYDKDLNLITEDAAEAPADPA